MKKKIEKIAQEVISYIGTFCLGLLFAIGLIYTFDKWVCAGLICASILFSIRFISNNVEEEEE